MSSKTHAVRLIALMLLAMLATSACAAGNTGSSQPATATAAPVAVDSTEEPSDGPAGASTDATAAMAAGDEQRTFAINPTKTVVSYEVQEEFGAGALSRLGVEAGLAKTVGRTSAAEGALTLDFAGPVPQLMDANFSVDISTLTSNQSRRDGRIRDQWLESGRFPIASFSATAIQNAPAAYSEGDEVTFQVAGDLTVRNVTNPVVFEVTATLDGDTITGVAATGFPMSTFGVDPPQMTSLFTVGDDTVIRVEFVAQEQ